MSKRSVKVQKMSPQAPAAPVTKSNVVAAFIESIHEAGLELGAWRQFGVDVRRWLDETGHAEAFEKWRSATKPRT